MKEEHSMKVSGTTTIGERGQVVIPAEIRKVMNLKTGDKLLVFCKFEKFIGLIKAVDLDQFLEKITGHVNEKLEKLRKNIKEHTA